MTGIVLDARRCHNGSDFILFFMKDFRSILKTMGFLESETSVYLALFEKGSLSTREISTITRLSRQGTYLALEALKDRGLVSTVSRGRKNFFQPEPPEKILDLLNRKILDLGGVAKDIKGMIPELTLKMGGEKPIVKLFEGKEGIRAIIDEFNSTPPREVIEITDLDALNHILSLVDLKPLKQKLDQLGTRTKAIYYGHSQLTRKSTQVVLVDELKSFRCSIAVSEDKILLVTFEGKMYSIILENRSLSKTMKYIFELAFESLQREKFTK